MVHQISFTVLIACFLNTFTSLTASIGPSEDVYVMTKFAELPKFYEERRSQNPQHKSKLLDCQRLAICRQIFDQKRVIIPNIKDNEKILKRDYHLIFEELFKEDETPRGVFSRMPGFRSIRRSRYIYDNSSKSRTFLVGENERDENTFACVIRNSDDDRTQADMYYVSDYAYNVNDLRDGETISGRFVFFDNKIHALAEVRPELSLYFNFQESTDCMKKNYRDKIAENWENDPVCKPDSGRKIRLCTYVCAFYHNGCADKVAVREPCTKKAFTLKNESYDGWMLTCEIIPPRLASNGEEPFTLEKEFYLTRTYRNNEVYVFRKGIGGEPSFWFRLRKVGFVLQDEEC